jgi:hypothetical protein
VSAAVSASSDIPQRSGHRVSPKEMFFGEGHFPAPTLARDLNEAWLARGQETCLCRS